MDENNRYEKPEPNRDPKGVNSAIFMVFGAFTYVSAFFLWLFNFSGKFIIIFLITAPVLMVIALIVVFLIPDGLSPEDIARREIRRRRADKDALPGSRPGAANRHK